MSEELLKQFEIEADARVQQLPLLRLPLATLLTGLYYQIDYFENGDPFGRHPPHSNLARATAETLSYLGNLFARCPFDRIESDSADAWQTCQEADPRGQQFEQLRMYGQFCDLMPMVHGGYYRVEGDSHCGFKLSLAEEFSRYEERDTILNELSQERFSRSPTPAGLHVRRLASTYPQLDAAWLLRAMTSYYEYEIDGLQEPIAITPEGFESAARVPLHEYRRFRSAWASLATVIQSLNREFADRIRHWPKRESERLLRQYHSTHSVLLRQDFAIPLLRQLSGLTESAFHSLLSLFSIDASTGPPAFDHSGERYFPPILLNHEFLLFNPLTLQMMMCVRNLLYAVKKRDQRRFDNAVSGHMEPQLLEEAKSMLGQVPGLNVVISHDWQAEGSKGEIDLLAYSAAENLVHIQAKGALPPMGARAVRRLEQRVEEGLEQLARFRNLSPAAQDDILTKAIGQTVRNPGIIDVILTRTNFGTARVWKRLGEVVGLNIAVLRALMQMAQARGEWQLSHFRLEAENLLDHAVRLARPTWVDSITPLFGTVIRCSWLDFSDAELAAAREWIWSDESETQQSTRPPKPPGSRVRISKRIGGGE